MSAWTLAIDTAAGVNIGLATDGQPVDRRTETSSRRHVESLQPMIDELLAAHGIGLTELALIAVGIGPGPFTGLRIGIVTARTLAMAAGIGVRAFGTLDAIAMTWFTTNPPGTPAVVVTDARRKELYWASYDASGSRVAGPAVGAPAAHPHPAARAGVGGHQQRIGQVLRPIGRQRRGRTHGARQHHRLGRAQHPLQQVGGFLQRVGAVRHHQPGHVGALQVVLHARQQGPPHRRPHVLAVDLGHLLVLHMVACRHRNAVQQRLHANLASGVAGVVVAALGTPGNGATGAQHHHGGGHCRLSVVHVFTPLLLPQCRPRP